MAEKNFARDGIELLSRRDLDLPIGTAQLRLYFNQSAIE